MSCSRSPQLKDAVVNFGHWKLSGQGWQTDWLLLVLGALRGQEGRKSPEKQPVRSFGISGRFLSNQRTELRSQL